MAAQSGKLVIVRIQNNAVTPAFEVVGGLRTKAIAMTHEGVDITNSGSTGATVTAPTQAMHTPRQYLPGVGVQSMNITGDGIFIDDQAATEINEAFYAGALRTYQFEVPDFGIYEGPFMITSFELSGEYNTSVNFSATFESGGDIVFTADT